MIASKEYALALIRVVSQRLKHIDSEVTATGVALAGGLIDPKLALDMVEEVAPGCLDAVARSILDKASDVVEIADG